MEGPIWRSLPLCGTATRSRRGQPEVILEGRAGMKWSLSCAGFRTRAHLPLPSVDAPDLILPLGPDSPAHYALARWRPGETPAKLSPKHRGGSTGAMGESFRVGLDSSSVLCDSGTPMLIGAASGYGIPADVGWFMTLAHGDDLTRGVFHLFPPAAREPAWVLKSGASAGLRRAVCAGRSRPRTRRVGRTVCVRPRPAAPRPATGGGSPRFHRDRGRRRKALHNARTRWARRARRDR